MSFQFKCPQGHLLEGDPAHAGQQCHCPICGMLFIIPAPLSEPAPSAQSVTSNPPFAPSDRSVPVPAIDSAAPAPQVPDPANLRLPAEAFAPAAGGSPASSGQVPTTGPSTESPVHPAPSFHRPAEAEEGLLHIPCPNGHELETPREMLGQDVLCPYCQAQFRLREKDSVEFQRRRAAERERQERRRSRAWFNWAIVALVLVVLGILFLIFSSSG